MPLLDLRIQIKKGELSSGLVHLGETEKQASEGSPGPLVSMVIDTQVKAGDVVLGREALGKVILAHVAL